MAQNLWMRCHGSEVNSVQVVVSEFNVIMFFVTEKIYVDLVICISCLNSCLCVYSIYVIVMSSAYAKT